MPELRNPWGGVENLAIAGSDRREWRREAPSRSPSKLEVCMKDRRLLFFWFAAFLAVVFLAIGGIIEKPVVKNGEIVIGHTMKVTVSADHRVTDGAEAAEFLVKFKELMENPMRLLV